MAAARRPIWTVLAGVAGGACGYFACVVAANSEACQFYTVRRWATGESAMSRIVHHPADRWVTPILVALFVSADIGAVITVRRWLCHPPLRIRNSL